MKRAAALFRRTPLRPGKPIRRWVRPEEDKISPELANYILDRDRMCLAYRVEGPTHQCRTRFGEVHAPDDRAKLDIAHVKRHARMGKRAEPSKGTLVAECGWANNEGWSSANREAERSYLALKEPNDVA